MNHYDAVGFTGITDGESISAAIDQVLPLAQAFGDYAVYRDASGAELWTAIDQNNELLAFEPYFSGCLNARWRKWRSLQRVWFRLGWDIICAWKFQ